MQTTGLTTLEEQVLEMLLYGNDEVFVVLRQQAKKVHVSSRKMTGVGFFTDFEVPLDMPRVEWHPTLKLGDVVGEADNVKHGVGFLLYVDGGTRSMLEGYTYEEPWPDEVCGLVLKYSKRTGSNVRSPRPSESGPSIVRILGVLWRSLCRSDR